MQLQRFGEKGCSWWDFFSRVSARHNPTMSPFKQRGKQTIDEAYHTFHWADSKKSIPVDLPEPPKDVFVIGRLVELQYLPIGSSGKPHEIHTHSFGDYGWKKDENPNHAPLLLADAKDNLYIAHDDSKFTVAGPGIVG